MKYLLVAFAVFWPLVIQVIYGVRSVDPTALDTAAALQVRGLRRFVVVILPSAAPFVATGLRVAAAVALIVDVVAELIGGGSGVGLQILTAENSGPTAFPVMYAYILVAGLLVLLAGGSRSLSGGCCAGTRRSGPSTRPDVWRLNRASGDRPPRRLRAGAMIVAWFLARLARAAGRPVAVRAAGAPLVGAVGAQHLAGIPAARGDPAQVLRAVDRRQREGRSSRPAWSTSPSATRSRPSPGSASARCCGACRPSGTPPRRSSTSSTSCPRR